MQLVLANASSAHAASISKRSFTVGGGSISGLLTPIGKPSKGQAVTAGLLDPSGIQYFVVTGQLVGSHDAYPLQFTANRGQKIGVVEISSDPVVHTQVIAVGAPTDRLLNPHTQQGSLQGQTQHETARVVPSRVVPFSSGGRSFTTTWYDPIGITVNWVKDTINFSYNGTDVTSFSGYDNRWWLSNDGWYEASHYIGSGYTGAGADSHIQAAVYTGDTMQNNIFCVGQSTYVYYSNNAVLANGNGSTFGSISTWDGGGCSGLLHYGTALS